MYSGRQISFFLQFIQCRHMHQNKECYFVE